jgi:hypothetical protein
MISAAKGTKFQDLTRAGIVLQASFNSILNTARRMAASDPEK